uniref:Uncharacterized protein n=1 Tax=Rhizophagus irregularis (strain DAOM 181602 / DAOM 197198 / MUCL 43194) TaxID=747089 RepID=U9TIW7_RHIID
MKVGQAKVPQSIQECCGNFNNPNIYTNRNIRDKVIESERNCKLCGKLYRGTYTYRRNNKEQFRLCQIVI